MLLQENIWQARYLKLRVISHNLNSNPKHFFLIYTDVFCAVYPCFIQVFLILT